MKFFFFNMLLTIYLSTRNFCNPINIYLFITLLFFILIIIIIIIYSINNFNKFDNLNFNM